MIRATTLPGAHYSGRAVEALARGEHRDPESIDVDACRCAGECCAASDPYAGQSDAFISAALELAAIEADDSRHTCAYCLCSRWHAITIYVGKSPGGDDCRACPAHLGQLLVDRRALALAATLGRAA